MGLVPPPLLVVLAPLRAPTSKARGGGRHGEPPCGEGRGGRGDHAEAEGADAVIVTEYRGMKVGAAGRSAPPASRAGRRVQGVQEHPGPFRRRRTPASTVSPSCSVGPTALAFVTRRRGRGRQGAARRGQDQPAAGRQGRCDVRQGDVRQGRRGPGRAARPARCCWPSSPAPCRPRWSRPPACCRPCPATSPTASRPSSNRRRSRLTPAAALEHQRPTSTHHDLQQGEH